MSIKKIENVNEEMRKKLREFEELKRHLSLLTQQNKVVTETVSEDININFQWEALPELQDLLLDIDLDSFLPANDFLPDEVQESIFSGMFNVYEINQQENLNLFHVNSNH